MVGRRAGTSLLSVTLLAFDVRGQSCVPPESLSSGPSPELLSPGEAGLSGARRVWGWMTGAVSGAA